MKLQLNKLLAQRLEIGITFILCIFYLGIAFPGPITSAFALLSFLIIPLLIVARWKQFIYVATRDLILFLLVGTAVTSVLWSTNPGATLAHCRAFLSTTVFGIYLATRYTVKEQMRLITWVFITYLFINLIAFLIPPQEIFVKVLNEHGWYGIAKHKNELSGIMAASVLLFLDIGLYGRKYRQNAFVGAIIAFIILVISKGKGSLAVVMVLLPFLPVYNMIKQKYRWRTVLGIFALMVLVAIFITFVANAEFIVVDLLGKDMEGTGRKDLWTYLIQRGLERPWLGYGYGGFWTNQTESYATWLKFSWISGLLEGGGNAHSTYIEVFLQLGWLGVLLTILSFLTLMTRVVLLLSMTRQIEYFWMFQIILLIALTGYYESYAGFLAYRNLFWVLYTSIACSTAIHLRRIFKTGNKLVNQQLEKTL